ncbi:DUF1146 family protein [Abyssicoccus albus]|uniref:DUF1146 family protein n=1 Tax=Abyssicoccus albus TaxID=1817405 RepID=UPI00097E37B5|nr:DUF1146 family protein [Abyssicoccus albus]AQL55710.1 hypothetical protein BVH56_01445 [Abyssicoccus albus]
MQDYANLSLAYVLIYLLSFMLAYNALLKLNVEQLFKKGSVIQIQIFVIMISTLLSFGTTQFIMELFTHSRNIPFIFLINTICNFSVIIETFLL